MGPWREVLTSWLYLLSSAEHLPCSQPEAGFLNVVPCLIVWLQHALSTHLSCAAHWAEPWGCSHEPRAEKEQGGKDISENITEGSGGPTGRPRVDSEAPSY